MSETTYLDPLELPFTLEEVFEALRLWVSDDAAAEMTDQFAETAQIDIQNRAERRERLLMAGVDDGGDRTNFRWLTPECLLPTLSVLSDDCRTVSSVVAINRTGMAPRQSTGVYDG